MKQSRHLKSAVSCWPGASFLQGWKQKLLGPIASRASLPAVPGSPGLRPGDSPPSDIGLQQCCRERTTLLYFASFLFPAKDLWLTWWDTTLALIAIPMLFHGYQWPAVKQLSVWPLQSNASSKLVPSCPNDVPRTYKGYNVRMIILHFSFSLNTLQEEVA